MDLAMRDKIIQHLQVEIKRTQGNVMDQLVDIDEIRRENSYLNDVYDDYRRYHTYIIDQKRRQKEQMEMLVNYLEKSLMEAGVTDSMEKHARFEQNRIMKDLDTIKEELEEIISQDNLND